jgi:hypothetical protein
MNPEQLADTLDKLFGNPLGPKRYALVREAVDTIRTLDQECKAYEKHIAVQYLKELQNE